MPKYKTQEGQSINLNTIAIIDLVWTIAKRKYCKFQYARKRMVVWIIEIFINRNIINYKNAMYMLFFLNCPFALKLKKLFGIVIVKFLKQILFILVIGQINIELNILNYLSTRHKKKSAIKNSLNPPQNFLNNITFTFSYLIILRKMI